MKCVYRNRTRTHYCPFQLLPAWLYLLNHKNGKAPLLNVTNEQPLNALFPHRKEMRLGKSARHCHRNHPLVNATVSTWNAVYLPNVIDFKEGNSGYYHSPRLLPVTRMEDL